MSIEKRIERLETHTSKEAGDNEPVWLIVVVGRPSVNDDMEAIKTFKEAANAKVEAALAEYRAKHPECAEKKIHILSVGSEKAKELTLRLLNGELPGDKRN